MEKDPRFDAFDQKLQAVAQAEKQQARTTPSTAASAADGMRIGAELITAPMAGALIGYGVDKWLHTKPIFLVALLILGAITGFVNVWRLTNNHGTAVGMGVKQPNANDRDTESKG